MPPLTDAQIAAKLIKAGCLPSLVEAALTAAQDAQQAAPDEIDVARDSIVTDADVAFAQMFWWYSPDVAQPFKRLLTARNKDAD